MHTLLLYSLQLIIVPSIQLFGSENVYPSLHNLQSSPSYILQLLIFPKIHSPFAKSLYPSLHCEQISSSYILQFSLFPLIHSLFFKINPSKHLTQKLLYLRQYWTFPS